jgi:muramoyltetrapeptide carboxypeptidase
VARLRDWGLEVRRDDELDVADFPWLAGSDEARAAALEAAWTDPEVSAVWCSRGGFGSQRVLDLLDWDVMASARPTWLVGFSDATALHQAFASRLGVGTIHAAGVAGLAVAAPLTLASTRALLLDGAHEPLAGTPGGGGRTEGVLVGGTLTLLASLLGTSDSRPARDSIALLEDVGESPYRLDRLLTQLLQGGWFDEVRGIACGGFTDCGDPAEVHRLLRARLEPLDCPLVLDLPVGHGPVNAAVPLGRTVQLDGDAGTLS